MSAPRCPCGKPASQAAYLCTDCRDALWRALGDVTALADELGVALARQARFEAHSGSQRPSGAVLPLPYDPAASDALTALRDRLAAIVRACQRHALPAPNAPRSTPPASNGAAPPTPDAMARWLMWRVDAIAAQPWAADALALVPLAQRCERVIDRPRARTYAGPCDTCGRDLYAQHGHAVVTCQPCGLDYDLAARRAWLLAAVGDRLATATEIARALTSLDVPVTAERIRQWKRRVRVDVIAHDRLGRPLFRVGDVIALLNGDTHAKIVR